MPDATGQRIIAVEEHFATTRYWEETQTLTAFPGEDAERVYSRSFITNEFISRRLTDLQTRLDEMNDALADIVAGNGAGSPHSLPSRRRTRRRRPRKSTAPPGR